MRYLLILLLFLGVARSQSVVTSLGDHTTGSYRSALASVPDGGTITFDPSLDGQTISLFGIIFTDGRPPINGPPPISKSITIDASALENGVTIDCGGHLRALEVVGDHVINVSGVTFSNCVGTTSSGGNTRGGAIVLRNSGSLMLENCQFFNCSTSTGGGAVYVESGVITADNCTFAGNSATNDGGAVHCNNGSMNLTNCTFHDNEAGGNGGAVNIGNTTVGSLITHCTFTSNLGGTGFAIRIVNGGIDPVITGCLFADPRPGSGSYISGTSTQVDTLLTNDPINLFSLGDYGGKTQTRPPRIGSLAVDGVSTVTSPLDQRGISRDSTPDYGAAEGNRTFLVTSDQDDPALEETLRGALEMLEAKSTIAFDTALSGAVILLDGTEGGLEISQALVLDASGLAEPLTLDGSAVNEPIISTDVDLTLDSLILEKGQNDGLRKEAGSELTLMNCTIRDNGSQGLDLKEGQMTLSDCVIQGNSAAGIDITDGTESGLLLSLNRCAIRNNNGGGILSDRHHLTILNSEISENMSNSDGAGLNLNGQTLLENVTIAGNSTTRDGGGIFINDGGDDAIVTLNHCTITANTANLGGGVRVSAFHDGTIFCRHTAIAGNFANIELRKDFILFQPFDLDGYSSLFGTDPKGNLGQTVFSNAVRANLLIISPSGFAPLGNYGGPTRTCPPLPHAPVVDAGVLGRSIPLSDQRGEPRQDAHDSALGPAGRPDIGAVELQPSGLFPIDLDDDGVPTLLEIALGTDPLNSDPAALSHALPSPLADTTQKGVTFGLAENYDAEVAAGFSINVERSFDLQGFHPVLSYTPEDGEFFSSNGVTPTLDPERLSVVDPTTEEKVFYRVSAGQRLWQTENIAASFTGDSTNTKIDVDSGGEIAVVYYDQALDMNTIFYATEDGTGWSTEAVASGIFDSTEHTFAISPTDVPTVAFLDRGDDLSTVLKVAQREETGWTVSTVSTGGLFQSDTFSLSFTSAGQPAVSFVRDPQQQSGDNLYYSVYDGTTWNEELVTGVGFAAVKGTSLAFDLQGQPSIAYAQDYVSFARFDGTDWQVSTVFDDRETSREQTIRHLYNPAGQPVVMFFANSRTYYSEFDGTSWEHVALEPIFYDTSADLIFDQTGRPVISNYNRGSLRRDLNLFTYDGTEFVEETITQAVFGTSNNGSDFLLTNNGNENSIVILPDGTPAVSHIGNGYIRITRLRYR